MQQTTETVNLKRLEFEYCLFSTAWHPLLLDYCLKATMYKLYTSNTRYLIPKTWFYAVFGSQFILYISEEDPDKIQKENEELKDLYTCKICLDERVGITFVPCGHLVTCKDCSPKIRRCPLCRTFIRGTIKTTM